MMYDKMFEIIKNVIGELAEKINNEDGHNVVTNISSMFIDGRNAVERGIYI